MDQNRMATLTRSLTRVPSRRDVLRSLAAIGIGLRTASLPRLAAASKRATGEAAAQANKDGCRNNGARCRRNQQCCSGTCRRKEPNGEKRCRRTPGAHGCTIEDGCLKVRCPGDSNGRCAVTVSGKPFCFVDGACFACTSNQDCDDQFNVTGARCVECPEECAESDNFRACVVYAPESAS